MKKITISEKSLDPFFEKLEGLSKAQRMAIFIGTVVLIAGAFIWFSYYPKHESLKAKGVEKDRLTKELKEATSKASRLNELRNQLAAAEAELKRVGEEMPEKEEIPSLLAGVSESGQKAGLEFQLFQPKPEIRREFYAEIPVSITVEGTYHNVGEFFDRVSNLSRIVTMQDITIKPKTADPKAAKNTKAASTSDRLTTSCTAVTYKFVEEEAPKPGPKKKPSKGGKQKKTS